MPAGLQIFNDAGIIQLDESTLNFVMRQKGTVTCSSLQNTGGVNYYTTTITYTGGTSPMLALACTTDVTHSSLVVSGTTWTWTILSLTANASVGYWVFDVAVNAETFGFEIYNSAGQKVFGLTEKPMRIHGAGAGTYFSGRTYATIQTANGWRWFETNPGGSTYRYQAFYGGSAVNGAVITVPAQGIRFEDYTIPGYGTFTPQSYDPPALTYLAVDVTHF